MTKQQFIKTVTDNLKIETVTYNHGGLTVGNESRTVVLTSDELGITVKVNQYKSIIKNTNLGKHMIKKAMDIISENMSEEKPKETKARIVFTGCTDIDGRKYFCNSCNGHGNVLMCCNPDKNPAKR